MKKGGTEGKIRKEGKMRVRIDGGRGNKRKRKEMKIND